MDDDSITRAIAEAINEILSLNDEKPVEIFEDLCPIKDIENFDSLNSLEATVVICDRLKIEVPSASLMICPERQKALTIAEIRERVTDLCEAFRK